MYKKLILMEYRGLTIQPNSKETIKTLSAHCTHTSNGDQKSIASEINVVQQNFVLEVLRRNGGMWQWKHDVMINKFWHIQQSMKNNDWCIRCIIRSFFFCMKLSYLIIALRNIEKLDNVFSHDE